MQAGTSLCRSRRCKCKCPSHHARPRKIFEELRKRSFAVAGGEEIEGGDGWPVAGDNPRADDARAMATILADCIFDVSNRGISEPWQAAGFAAVTSSGICLGGDSERVTKLE
uniref:Uncharacterized protein n=1 Tax=Craspedostauros australis TaxID=1486917 RepID=A0A6T6I1F4_9STRA|mmetsp:Transcript_826/g.2344  ORF Transcript_826/g.2344 Transcript_826/m.2344 type:complete len:112 (+) Transcript_826:150-485(+)